MKKLPAPSRLLSLLLLAVLPFVGCKKSETPPPAPRSPAAPPSAEKTSFQEVTAQLDPGGSLYLYLSTEQLLNGVSDRISQWRNVFGSLPDVKPEDQENITKVFDLLTHLVRDSGLEDVSGVGLSSLAREPGFYHGKAVVHHYKGKGTGFLWTLFGSKPHSLEGLNLLPANTVFAACSDLDVPLLWSVIQKEAGQSGFPQAQQFLETLPDNFEAATGLKWNQVLASLGGQYAVAMTLDDTRMVTIPLPGGGLEIPEPALMFVAKVKDDTLFNRIDKALDESGQQIIRADKPNLKMRTLPLPLPLPIQVRPTVARSGDYLFIASTDALIQQALAVQAGQKPGLKSTPEFQRLAKDIPQQGNQFMFISQQFGRTIVELQRQALAQAPAQAQWLQSLLTTNGTAFTYTVGASTDEGWLAVANGNQHPAKLCLAGSVVPIAMLSAVAIPNFVKARSTAQKNACINNLRQIDAAKQQWAVENKKTDTSIPTRADLSPFLKSEKFPVCPAGGTYTLNPVGDPPRCSLPGHALGD